jgi:segregation and condensation protein B
MSKKSRKNKSAGELSPETPSPEELSGDGPVEVLEIDGQGDVEEGISSASEAIPATDAEASSLPEAVSQELLGAEVPAGEVPPLSHVLEAILFASQKAILPKELVAHLKSAAAAEPTSVAAAFARIKEGDIHDALLELQAEVAASGRAYQVRETATGWLLSSAPGFAPWLRALYPEAKPTRLSASALETLAIIAYRQPIARADMEAVRGVSVDGVMQTLLDRGLVKIAGRAEVAGRPLLYATTQFFLDHFGLRTLDELPNAAELRHIPLPKATPEQGSAPVDKSGTAELPGVLEEVVSDVTEASEGSVETQGGEEAVLLEEVDVTEIIEVRESVVFEEVVFDAKEEETAISIEEEVSEHDASPEGHSAS